MTRQGWLLFAAISFAAISIVCGISYLFIKVAVREIAWLTFVALVAEVGASRGTVFT